MKIYFAGSIRGGREDVALYGEIIELLKQRGQVLTEHVGQIDLREEEYSDSTIYRRDMSWLAESDVVVAEVTVPSHGVGFEIARAETLGKPILCLFRPSQGRRVSALIAGNAALRCEPYEGVADVEVLLDQYLSYPSKRRE